MVPLLGESDIGIIDPDSNIISIIHSLTVRYQKTTRSGIRWGARAEVNCSHCGTDDVMKDKKSTMMKAYDWTLKMLVFVFNGMSVCHQIQIDLPL